MSLLAVIGTRPEAIKMAPLLLALRREPEVDLRLCVTGQHREMLDPVLDLFELVPDVRLDLMRDGQSLTGLAGRCFSAIDAVLAEARPDRVLVHGDTTTAMAAALAAAHRQVPVGHVEAGLRSGDLDRPFPEEMNRRAIDTVSDLLFAPTAGAKRNLIDEGHGGRIAVTGNTGVDALHIALATSAAQEARPTMEGTRKLILVTGHRRESFGDGLSAICEALRELARRGDVEIVWPVHLNPKVKRPVEQALTGSPHVRLLPPLDYLPLLRLMQRSDLILTDSGGIQEEAPSLGKPVLVMRDVTERPEAIAAGQARLVGTNKDRIVAEASALLDDGATLFRGGANPFGDGKASGRIVAALLGRPFEEFGA
ncbi:MAG TPA: UDP-N-acetylglucosamine 2-epimerase (non-hydrolyzing) [Allosphingosinicella sp.]